MLDVASFFFLKQKTAYELRISDWSSDVCSSDLSDPRCQGCSIIRFRPGIEDRLLNIEPGHAALCFDPVALGACLPHGGSARVEQRDRNRNAEQYSSVVRFRESPHTRPNCHVWNAL